MECEALEWDVGLWTGILGCEMNSSGLEREQWRVPPNVVMNVRVP